MAGLTFDTMVASYLLESGERNHNMDELAERYLAHPTRTMAEIADLLGFSGPSALARWHQAQFGMPATVRRKALLAQASPRTPRAGGAAP